ncbi:MAG: histidine triad nucleotide-binding protein [Acidobacteria bacterium]|nr:histidine triad nucleotide-binding protein [Acidobacteriota bacterium]
MSESPDCLFCKIINGEIPSKKVYEDDSVFAFEDINPVAPIHILIVPKKHIATLNELEDEDTELTGKIVQTAKMIAADKGINEEGYRLIFNCQEKAGQTVFHIHLHILGGRTFGWPPG